MFAMRPAVVADRELMTEMIRARARWMHERGLRGAGGWERHAAELGAQAGDPHWPVWVLTDERGRLVGRTTVGTESPAWCWTEEERREPAVFLSTTVTHPNCAGQGLGCMIASWALDYAARHGLAWVRRGTGPDPGLVRYYRDVQGWQVVRSVERHGVTAWALARRSERQPELSAVVAVSDGSDAA